MADWIPTTEDRCDRCGAQAFLLAVVQGVDLVFCAHHGTEHLEALSAAASYIRDNRQSVNSRPSVAAY